MNITNMTPGTEKWLNAKEAAAFLCVTDRTFRRFATRSDMPAPELGDHGEPLWREADILGFQDKAAIRSPNGGCVFGLMTVDWDTHEIEWSGMDCNCLDMYGEWMNRNPYEILDVGAAAEQEGKHVSYLVFWPEQDQLSVYSREEFATYALEEWDDMQS